VLDLKQLKVFADQRLYDYLRFNALGLLIPPVVTVWEACHWLQQPSPERDHFDHLVRSKLMQKIIIVLAVATQTHVILLVMWSVRFKQKLGITSWHHLAAWLVFFLHFPTFNVSVLCFDKHPLSGSTPSCREPRMPRLVRYSQSLKW
jgi:hypothetical protein